MKISLTAQTFNTTRILSLGSEMSRPPMTSSQTQIVQKAKEKVTFRPAPRKPFLPSVCTWPRCMYSFVTLVCDFLCSPPWPKQSLAVTHEAISSPQSQNPYRPLTRRQTRCRSQTCLSPLPFVYLGDTLHTACSNVICAKV
jgi:hypothetical protein